MRSSSLMPRSLVSRLATHLPRAFPIMLQEELQLLKIKRPTMPTRTSRGTEVNRKVTSAKIMQLA